MFMDSLGDRAIIKVRPASPQLPQPIDQKHLREKHPNTSHQKNDGLMLDQRCRRWANIKPALGEVCCSPGHHG